MSTSYTYRFNPESITPALKIKKLHPHAVIPERGTKQSAGLDLTATTIERTSNDRVIYGTGLAIEIPSGCFGMLAPRSSIHKYHLMLTNHVGIIDSDYRGEIKLIFRIVGESDQKKIYEVGDRIGQLIILPYATFPIVETQEELSETERGTGGFGSTGV